MTRSTKHVNTAPPTPHPPRTAAAALSSVARRLDKQSRTGTHARVRRRRVSKDKALVAQPMGGVMLRGHAFATGDTPPQRGPTPTWGHASNSLLPPLFIFLLLVIFSIEGVQQFAEVCLDARGQVLLKQGGAACDHMHQGPLVQHVGQP